MGAKEMVTYRDKFVAAQKAKMVALTGQVTAGDIGMLRWQKEMRDVLRTSFIDQYVMAKGGRGNMTPSDWGKIGRMLQGQEKYLRNFAADIYAGDVSKAQAAVRAAMYAGSSRQAFEAGKAAELGMPDLPQYPGDGGTVCKTNCACSWAIVEVEGGWDCTWTLGAAEHCPDCVELAAQWAPLHVDKPAEATP
jgi:hypothetical protein